MRPTSLRKNCEGHLPVTRRHFLFGAATAASTSLLAAHPDAEVTTVGRGASVRGSARAVIFINMNGAPSHMDFLDPKDGPWNPRDADIRQHSNGLSLSNRFWPNLTRLRNDLLAVRSVNAWENAHERGQFYMQTAQPSNPAFSAEIPHFGAVIAREKANSSAPIPPFMSFNQGNLQGATFLGGRFQPMMPPAQRTGISTLRHDHFGTAAQSQPRFERRFQLLESLDAPLRRAPFNQNMADYASFYGQARGMMYSDPVANVFTYGADDEGRYGNTAIGRGLIIARNAVRAKNGAVFINVSSNGWDTHVGMFDTGMGGNFYQLATDFDRAVGALVDDLRASGDLDQTLIVMMGEFGRTPANLNARGGRDHWKDAMCVGFIGGGVRGGRAMGATSADGSRVTDPGWSGNRIIRTEDIACTIYSALGIDYTKTITDTPSGRTYRYVPGGGEIYTSVEEIFG